MASAELELPCYSVVNWVDTADWVSAGQRSSNHRSASSISLHVHLGRRSKKPSGIRSTSADDNYKFGANSELALNCRLDIIKYILTIITTTWQEEKPFTTLFIRMIYKDS